MGYSVRILKDSVAPLGNRLTTFELCYPRFIHSELLTHRQFSRNSSSSRAIPVNKMIERIESDPAIPVWWGKQQKGMQAREEIDVEKQQEALRTWLLARDDAIEWAKELSMLGLHKQIVNRVLEPWMFITVILTSSRYDNFFRLRCHEDAQPEIKWVADEMRLQLTASSPGKIEYEEWHMPYITQEDVLWCKDYKEGYFTDNLKKISVGRCTRVSYLTHEGVRSPLDDIMLAERLIAARPMHASPFEHVATPMHPSEMQIGNLEGWLQFRHEFKDESFRG